MDLGVGVARPLMRALPDDHAFVRDDTRADDGIRRRTSQTPARLLQRPAHPTDVRLRACGVLYHFS